jgi:hypothetical protein
MESSQKATDKAMMVRCVELSRIAVSKGEYPFGTVIATRPMGRGELRQAPDAAPVAVI